MPLRIAMTANDLLVELEPAHDRLRNLFAQGSDDEVLELATNIIELQSEQFVRSKRKDNDLAAELVQFHFS